MKFCNTKAQLLATRQSLINALTMISRINIWRNTNGLRWQLLLVNNVSAMLEIYQRRMATASQLQHALAEQVFCFEFAAIQKFVA